MRAATLKALMSADRWENPVFPLAAELMANDTPLSDLGTVLLRERVDKALSIGEQEKNHITSAVQALAKSEAQEAQVLILGF